MNEENKIDQPVNPVNPIEQPKPNNFLVMLLSVLLLISISIAGFFAYQTQKLVKELRSINDKLQNNPIATDEPVVELTANWKSYIDKLYGYSIKYPSLWNITPTPTNGFGGVATFSNNINKFEIGKQVNKIEPNITLKQYFIDQQPGEIEILKESEFKWGKVTALKLVLPLIHGDLNWKYGIYYIFSKDSEIYFLEYYTNDYKTDEAISDQILSTFKFTN